MKLVPYGHVNFVTPLRLGAKKPKYDQVQIVLHYPFSPISVNVSNQMPSLSHSGYGPISSRVNTPIVVCIISSQPTQPVPGVFIVPQLLLGFLALVPGVVLQTSLPESLFQRR